MKRLAGIMAAALLLAAGGQATVWAQGGKTTKVAPVPLRVTIHDLANDEYGMLTVPTRIRGDEAASGGPTYVDGDPDGTTAKIDEYGNLIIRFGRVVKFDFGAIFAPNPLPVGFPTGGWRDESYVSTMKPSSGDWKLQDLPGSWEQCIKFNWQYADEKRDTVRLGYQRAFIQQVEDPGTSYAVVTRTGPDTWSVEPVGACVTYSNTEVHKARVFKTFWRKTDGEKEEYGFHTIPFRLTLTRK